MVNLDFIGSLLKRKGFHRIASGYQKSIGNRECIIVSHSNWDVTYWFKGTHSSTKHHVMFIKSSLDILVLENKLKYNDI